MIPTRTMSYVDGDASTIENYYAATMDRSRVWKVFHRNTLTGVGRIQRNTLKSIGRYYAVDPRELIFLTKEMVKEIEERKPMTEIDAHRCHVVFLFWGQLHPRKPFSDITKDEFDLMYRSIRRLRVLFA